MVDNYYEIQMLQSRYRFMCTAGQYPTIPLQLFAKNEQVSISFESGQDIFGYDAVSDFYRGRLEKLAGGILFLRDDIPTTQVIEISDDGRTAKGFWETFSINLVGTENNVSAPDRAMQISIGRFETHFVREQSWRIRRLKWRPIVELSPWPFDPKGNGALSATFPYLWPHPPAQMNRYENSAPPHFGGRAETAARVENLFGRFIQDCNMGHFMSAADTLFSDTGELVLGSEMFTGKKEILSRYSSLGQGGAHRYVSLITSRVIEPCDKGIAAMWNALVLQIGPGNHVKPLHQRIYADFSQEKDGLKCKRLMWLPIAALENWTLKSPNAEEVKQ